MVWVEYVCAELVFDKVAPEHCDEEKLVQGLRLRRVCVAFARAGKNRAYLFAPADAFLRNLDLVSIFFQPPSKMRSHTLAKVVEMAGQRASARSYLCIKNGEDFLKNTKRDASADYDAAVAFVRSVYPRTTEADALAFAKFMGAMCAFLGNVPETRADADYMYRQKKALWDFHSRRYGLLKHDQLSEAAKQAVLEVYNLAKGGSGSVYTKLPWITEAEMKMMTRVNTDGLMASTTLCGVGLRRIKEEQDAILATLEAEGHGPPPKPEPTTIRAELIKAATGSRNVW